MTQTNGTQAAANVAAAATTALQTRKPPATMANFKSSQVADVFSLYREQIQRAIPKTLTTERVIQLATTMITRNPDLLKCTTESLVGAVLQCSILGFEPIPQLGLVYFVPRFNKTIGMKEIVFQLGYKGKIDLARRSNEIQTIYTQAVYSNDIFDYEFGLDPKMTHKPNTGDRGTLTFAYAVARYINGGYAFEVMSKHDIDKIRKRSASPDSGPWVTDYDAMAMKTVIHRLSKVLPLTVEIMKNIQADNVVISASSFEVNGGGVDMSKVAFESSDGETGEATVGTNAPGNANSEKAEPANVVNEATGEITQADVDALNEHNAALGNPMAPTKEEQKPVDDRPADERLLSEILTLDQKLSPVSVIQIWYQENLTAINNIKPATKAKKVMDALKQSLAAAKARA